MRHVVSFSGGVGSWLAAKRVADRHGTGNLTLLFTDTLIEDKDLYRFLLEGAADVFKMPAPRRLVEITRALPQRGDHRRLLLASLRVQANEYFAGRLVWIAQGLTPWEVFRSRRFLGNARVDPCSRVLKREMADAWLLANCDPQQTTVHVGIDWTAEHRFAGTGTKAGLRSRKAQLGWTYEAPLCNEPLLTKDDGFRLLAESGIARPRLYDWGLAHNNCGGCVKSGMAQFAMLLRHAPEVYAEWEEEEETLRTYFAKDIAILRDRSGGGVRPLSLREFRGRVLGGCAYDKNEFGGCGCFIDGDDDE